MVGESGGPVREFSFVAYLIPTFGSAAIGRRGIILCHDLLFFANLHVHILFLQCQGIRSASKLFMFGSGSAGARQKHLLVIQDKELLVFYVESLNPVASESVEYSVMNACLLGPFFVT